MHKAIDDGKVRFNVIVRPWRVVSVIQTTSGVETIRYTIEAESWNKAYMKASDEIPEIAALFGVSIDDVSIESVTGICQRSE
jgi:hypothetical protein